jgi:hypothetical protein
VSGYSTTEWERLRTQETNLATLKRTNLNGFWDSAYWWIFHKCRATGRRFPLRISDRWSSVMRDQCSSMGRQEGKISMKQLNALHAKTRLERTIHLHCKSKVKKWAYDNAWTLTLIAVLFFITWAAIIYLEVRRSV